MWNRVGQGAVVYARQPFGVGPSTDDMADLADREWRLIREEVLDGPSAMAYDEVAAETAAEGGLRTVRVYQWLPSTFSLGYGQSPETVDWQFCDKQGIDVTRRPTGGGGIYHDTYGDISYSIVAPAEDLPSDLMESYELLCEPILAALQDLGIDARFATETRPALYEPACYLRAVDPAHDVVAGDGRKISGNAQYRRRDAVVQHGSLTFEAMPELTLGCFTGTDVTPTEFRERVTAIAEQTDLSDTPDLERRALGPMDSLSVGRDHAVRTLEESLAAWCEAEEGEWTDDERQLAKKRAVEKYATEDWNRHRKDPTE